MGAFICVLLVLLCFIDLNSADGIESLCISTHWNGSPCDVLNGSATVLSPYNERISVNGDAATMTFYLTDLSSSNKSSLELNVATNTTNGNGVHLGMNNADGVYHVRSFANPLAFFFECSTNEPTEMEAMFTLKDSEDEFSLTFAKTCDPPRLNGTFWGNDQNISFLTHGNETGHLVANSIIEVVQANEDHWGGWLSFNLEFGQYEQVNITDLYMYTENTNGDALSDAGYEWYYNTTGLVTEQYDNYLFIGAICQEVDDDATANIYIQFLQSWDYLKRSISISWTIKCEKSEDTKSHWFVIAAVGAGTVVIAIAVYFYNRKKKIPAANVNYYDELAAADEYPSATY